MSGLAETEHAMLRLQLAPEAEALVRVLNAAVAAQARLRSVSHVSDPDGAWTILDLEGLGGPKVEVLAERLRSMACVRGLQRIGGGDVTGRLAASS